MRAAVIVFPGSNCDRDMAVAFQRITGQTPAMVWHKETVLPDGIDVVGLPGGFSYGDYLRCGAIAARSPICRAVADFAATGGIVLGVCNGFQVLTEMGLLPGALMRNAGIKFLCRTEALEVVTTDSPFTVGYTLGDTIAIPIAHHDGNYTVGPEQLAQLSDEDRIAFRYRDTPNGSAGDIAGVLSQNRRVLGMMPHPERALEARQGSADGAALFAGLAETLATA
ncbi:MAG: phosphoribosylformylglycinamidine synthase subunit PurQ [Rhodobacteraceae bacterium]|nr:phosphoribosylformylglycinamidine synthase subunit PurQ [Paracoccaceae bacterium]